MRTFVFNLLVLPKVGIASFFGGAVVLLLFEAFERSRTLLYSVLSIFPVTYYSGIVSLFLLHCGLRQIMLWGIANFYLHKEWGSLALGLCTVALLLCMYVLSSYLPLSFQIKSLPLSKTVLRKIELMTDPTTQSFHPCTKDVVMIVKSTTCITLESLPVR